MAEIGNLKYDLTRRLASEELSCVAFPRAVAPLRCSDWPEPWPDAATASRRKPRRLRRLPSPWSKSVEEDIRPQYRFTGRVEAIYKVDLRARVDGFLEKRLFIEGADVKEGELLFTIEKGQYQAAVDEAKAGIVTAEAALKLADIEFSRQSELVQKNVGAQARLDEATAKQGEARGTLLQQKATLERAQLNLSYTDIRAPIAGRIGRANFAVGNFVGPSSGSLATIVSQDPIYVGFPVTQREILAYRAEQSSPGAPAEVVVYLQLADGSRYKHAGKINFLDVTVNQGTDTVLVRASFPNPERTLVDGQLVAVVLESGKPQIVVVVPRPVTAARSDRRLRAGGRQ